MRLLLPHLIPEFRIRKKIADGSCKCDILALLGG